MMLPVEYSMLSERFLLRVLKIEFKTVLSMFLHSITHIQRSFHGLRERFWRTVRGRSNTPTTAGDV